MTAADLITTPQHDDDQQHDAIVCAVCGAVISDAAAAIEHDGERYCSDDCARSAGLAQCANCGEWHDADDCYAVAPGNGMSFCCYDCAYSYGFEQCAHCGEWFDMDNGGVYIEGYGCYCSAGCARSDGFEQCCDCDGWHRVSDMYTTRDGCAVCHECRCENYMYCDECGELVDDDDYDFDAEMCCDCARENSSDILLPYGYTPVLSFYGDTAGNTRPYLGVELEIDNSGGSRNDCLKSLAGMDLYGRVYLTADSSLDDGIEVTSHPMTLREHIDCGLWDDVRRIAADHDFTSHDNGRCGLHVHVNRSFFGKTPKAQAVGGFNLAVLVNRFERQMTIFSRRRDSRWCAYGRHADYVGKGHKANRGMFDKALDFTYSNNYEHSIAVNFQHSATFELRIFRGTLNEGTFNATLALVEGLALAAKHHGPTWCENVTWYDLVSCVLGALEHDQARDSLRSYLGEKGLL